VHYTLRRAGEQQWAWRGGDHVPEGATSESPVSLVDLCPAFLDAASAQDEIEFDGKSLLERAVQGLPGFREAVFSETWGSRMICTQEWRVVEYPRTEEAELYHLRRDPGEHENLDGPGTLPHLEDILGISEIDAIQWVPGAGDPPLIDRTYAVALNRGGQALSGGGGVSWRRIAASCHRSLTAATLSFGWTRIICNTTKVRSTKLT
jgi:hypothetical protein